MKAITLAMPLTCLLLTVADGLSSNQQEIKRSASEEHALFNSRPMSPEKTLLLQEKRCAELEISEKAAQFNSFPSSMSWQLRNISGFEELRNATAASYCSYLYHWIIDFPKENTIQLQNGSEWSFASKEEYIIRSWRIGDTLVLSPKSGWLSASDYSYYLTNKSQSGSYISVNPAMGPREWGPHTVWVSGIDQSKGHVYLVDGEGGRSTMVVHSTDFDLFRDWAVSDSIIVGYNDSLFWWFSSYDLILLNVNLNHYVRAREIQ